MSSYEEWLADLKKHAESRECNIQALGEAVHLDEQRLRSLDSTLKKVTAFTKKLKNIGTVSASQFLPDLDRYNLSKYLDEIATNICEAKVKTSYLGSLVEFCVKMASLYKDFPAHLVQEFRKQMPTKKSDKIENPSKLRVDLRLFSELLLNGVFVVLENEGIKLLGSVLIYIFQTDKQEHMNVTVLLPFCRNSLFPITGIVPLSIARAAGRDGEGVKFAQDQLVSKLIPEEKRSVMVKLFNDYWDSLIGHAEMVRSEMNKLRKSIKRQERTRGDASAEERERLELVKQKFERLHHSALELGEYLGQEVPEMPEEPSDDERDEAAARRLNTELSEGRVLLWPDRDTQLFYEALPDVTAYTPTAAAQASDAIPEEQFKERKQPVINESIESVDLTCLEEEDQQLEMDTALVGEGGADEEAEEELAPDEQSQSGDYEAPHQRQSSSASPTAAEFPGGGVQLQFGATASFQELLERLPQCINRELVDLAAIDFLKNYSRNKAHRKRIVQHFLQAPVDRLDLLPFYARFMATIRPAYPDIPTQVLQEFLGRFRAISRKSATEVPKKSEKLKCLGRIESKLHLCAFLSEQCKFGILPKAEALTCLRSLLVQMRTYRVDMLCVMLEQMGPFLYRSPDAHPKMAVILQVLRDKSAASVKDPRQKILLENAYFAVIPPEDQASSSAPALLRRRPPMQEFIALKLATEIRVSIFRRVDWDDEETREFTLRLLSSPWRVHFGQLACLASLVSALGDHQGWVAVRVLDELLEFIRLSLELNSSRLQQQAISSVAYFGQLFNYNVSNTATLFKVLYQLISLGLQPPTLADTSAATADQLLTRLQRVRLVCQLVDTVCEFFGTGKSKRRMDHFLCFFLRFYYETRDGWSQFMEELEEFPDEVERAVADLLRTWRKGEKFPTSLVEARLKVAEVEEQYKAKVNELLEGMRRHGADQSAADGASGDRLRRIAEEGEDDEEEEEEEEEFEGEQEEGEGDGSCGGEEEEGGGRHRHRKQQRSAGSGEPPEEEDEGVGELEEQQQQPGFFDHDEEEQIRVHTRQTQLLPEDEDFMRDFDRLMAESLQSAPVTLKGPMSELVVPPQAKQKFERKLTFSVTESLPSPKFDRAEGLVPREEHFQQQQQQIHPSAQARMALMLRTQAGGKGGAGGGGASGGGKGQVLLKPVQIAESENLAEKWRRAKEEEARDRREMKKLTLAMNERMTQEAEEVRGNQQKQTDLERKLAGLTGTGGGSYGGTGGI